MRNQLTLNMDFFYQKIKIIIRISIFLTYLLHISRMIVFTHLVYNSVLLKKAVFIIYIYIYNNNNKKIIICITTWMVQIDYIFSS